MTPALQRPLLLNPAWEDVAVPLAAAVGSLLVFGLFCLVMGASPASVYASIYTAGFGSWYSWQNTLVRAAPLMLCGLCTALPARAGIITVGNEGAFVIGGLAAIAMGLAAQKAPAPISLLAMVLAGGVAGGLWLMIPAALQHYRGVNAVIGSLLLDYIGIAILLQVVEGPLRDPGSLNFPATYALDPSHMLGNLPGTRVHWGLAFGLAACAAAWFLMEHTVWGMKIKVAGGNARTARLVGLPLGRLVLTAAFLGGACAGLAGMVEVAAVHGRASQAISAGYGYVGILVAFLARQSPLRVIVVSLLIGGLLASGGMLQRLLNLPDATIAVFQGMIFLIILASEALYGRLRIFGEARDV